MHSISNNSNMKSNLIKSIIWFIIFIAFTIYLVITLFNYISINKDLIYIIYVIENTIIGIIASTLELIKIIKITKSN